MIKIFAKAWEQNSKDLEKWFAETPQSEYDNYETIWNKILEVIVNPTWTADYMKFNTNKTVEIDHGDYQGTLIFLTPTNAYQPCGSEYVVTEVYYGSCSGCDTLLGISCYGEDLPNEQQVKDYMTLALHLLQKAKPLYSDHGEWVENWWGEEIAEVKEDD